jgi:RNA polymerase sigma-70 factor (ECF subfamily)
MADSPTDEDLVRSALAGDAGAYDRLVERYAPRVLRIIRAQVGDATVAEDLAQETFLSAFAALPGFRFDARFFTWLYRIMLNTVGQHQRKTARRRVLDAKAPRMAETGEAADAPLRRNETRDEVRRALADLSEDHRAALLLRECDELTYAQIAQILGCPAGTVASRIARARQMLAERMAHDEDMR